MSRSEEARRRREQRETEARVIEGLKDGKWALKNILLPEEKRLLMGFYQDELGHALMAQESLENEHLIRKLTERLKFVMDHF